MSEQEKKRDCAQTVTENLGLVHLCARRFSGRGLEYDDLYQAGCLGLVKAAQRFEPERGLRFSTYAVTVILGEIRRLLTERLSLRQQLERLEPRDRQLLELRYFQGLTQARTGAELGMTQVQVSRREKRLLELLRSELV